MFGIKEREYASCGFMDFENFLDFAEELSFDELLSVNGGCGGGCGGGSVSYTSSYTPSISSLAGSSSTSSSSGCGSRGVSSCGCGGIGPSNQNSSLPKNGGSCSMACGGGCSGGSIINGGNNNLPSDKEKGSGSDSIYVDNSNDGISNAKPGDKIIRKDGTEVTLTQGDIDWAKQQIAKNSVPVELTPSDPKNEKTTVNTESIKEDLESPTDSGIEKKETNNAGAPYTGIKSDQTLKDGQPVKIENATEIKDKVINSITDNWDKQYSYSEKYQCDNWVQEVLNDAGIDSSKYLTGGDASQKTVQEHIDALTAADSGKKVNVDYYTERPTEDGAYVVFMDDGSKKVTKEDGTISTVAVNEHCAIMIVKDGKTSFYDNSSGNGGTPYDASGNIIDLSKDNHPAVSYYDQGVGYTSGDVTWCYKTMYYQKVQ